MSLAGRYWGVGKPVGIIFMYDVETAYDRAVRATESADRMLAVMPRISSSNRGRGSHK